MPCASTWHNNGDQNSCQRSGLRSLIVSAGLTPQHSFTSRARQDPDQARKWLEMTIAPREFQIFVKPIGALCNLNCRYCYYLQKQNLYPQGESFRLPDDVLEEYIVQHMEACPTLTILFSWHGGEPTLLGLDYFRKIVALQRKHQSPGREIINGIQTNGMLLDEEWCRFFAAEKFFVGLSLDGPREFHDRYRKTKGQEPTHKRVMQSFRLLKRYHIHCDTLCVVNDQNVRHPIAVYHFFKEIGADFLQFLPLVERTKDGVSPETVPAKAYGTFLCTILHEWIRHDVGRIGIQIFDEAARPFLGMEHALCLFRETCGNFPVLEHNGSLFAQIFGSSQNSGVSLRVPHVQRKLVGESSQSCGSHRHGQ